MPHETPAEIEAKIHALEARLATFAGVRNTTWSDQSTTFSIEDAHKELARLKALLRTAVSGSTTRYASTSKGV